MVVNTSAMVFNDHKIDSDPTRIDVKCESERQNLEPERENEMTADKEKQSPIEEDNTLKEMLQVDEQYVPLLTLLEQFSPGEDGILFNRKLRHFVTTMSSMCPDESRLHQAFSTFRAAALLSSVTARKLAKVGASFTRQQSQQLLRSTLLNVFMQGTFTNMDTLKRSNPMFLINAANLMGDYFAEARLCNGNKVHILASPLLQYMRALLASDDIRAHRCLATQLMQNGRELLSVLAQELDELSISIRLRLLSPPPISTVWLLLSADLCLNKFLPLPNTLQQFYAAHLEVTIEENFSEVDYGSWKKNPEKEEHRPDTSEIAEKVSVNLPQKNLDNNEDTEQALSVSQDTFETCTAKNNLDKSNLNSWRQQEEEKQGDGAYIQNQYTNVAFNEQGGDSLQNFPERTPDVHNTEQPPPVVESVAPTSAISMPESVNNEIQKNSNRRPVDNGKKEKTLEKDIFETWVAKNNLKKRYDLNSWRQQEEEKQGDGAYIQNLKANVVFNQQGGNSFQNFPDRTPEVRNTERPPHVVERVAPTSAISMPERVNYEIQKNSNRRLVDNDKKEKTIEKDTLATLAAKNYLKKRYDLNSWRQQKEDKQGDEVYIQNQYTNVAFNEQGDDSFQNFPDRTPEVRNTERPPHVVERVAPTSAISMPERVNYEIQKNSNRRLVDNDKKEKTIEKDTLATLAAKNYLKKRYDLNSWRQQEEDKQGDEVYIQNQYTNVAFNEQGDDSFQNYPDRTPDVHNTEQLPPVVESVAPTPAISMPESVNNEIQKNSNSQPVDNRKKEKTIEKDIFETWVAKNNLKKRYDLNSWRQQEEEKQGDEAYIQNQYTNVAFNQQGGDTFQNFPVEKDDPNRNRQRNQTRQKSKDNVSEDEDEEKYKDRSTSRNRDKRSTRMNRRSSEKEERGQAKTPIRRHVTEVPRNPKYWDHDDRCDKDYNS